MNLRLLGYLRSYKAIRALIIYRYLYEIYKNYQETLYQAESFFFDLAAWDNQNTQKIEQGGDTTKQKTATWVENFSPENSPGLEQPESQNCIGFKAVFIYDLRPINLFYFRARYYDPIMGRFLCVDPMGYKDSMNLYQAFNMNPVNFLDPFGKVIHEWKNLGVYGPASWRPDEPIPYALPTYSESGAYARFKDFIKIEPVQKKDGTWTIRARFKMIVAIWLTNRYKLEHEKAHIVQYMNLYMGILRWLERMEVTGDRMRYETKEKAQEAIDRMAGKDYSKIKKLKIKNYQPGSIHDKFTRKRANEIINQTNYFEMKKTTDPPFKVKEFEEVKTWLDYILGIKDEKKDEK